MRAAAEETTLAHWQTVLQVNLASAFQLSQLAARDMIAHNVPGKIGNLALLLSFQGGIRVPAYAASKGGITQLTKALANECRRSASTSTPSRPATSPPPTLKWLDPLSTGPQIPKFLLKSSDNSEMHPETNLGQAFVLSRDASTRSCDR